jgi:hypothetical protein
VYGLVRERLRSIARKSLPSLPANLKHSKVSSATLDVFLTHEAAEAQLDEILEDEPEWVNVLRVVPVELDGRDLSAN